MSIFRRFCFLYLLIVFTSHEYAHSEVTSGPDESPSTNLQEEPISIPAVHDFCTKHNHLLTQWMRKNTPVREIQSQKNIQTSKVIFIGENHDTQIQSKYPELIAKLKHANPQINCLYIEAHKSYYPEIEAIKRGEVANPELKNLLQYKHLLNLGLKIVLVDNHWTVDKNVNPDKAIDWINKNPELSDIEYRNQTISSEIYNSLKNNECTSGIMIAGYKHLLSTHTKGMSLKTKMEKLNVPTVSMMAVDSGCARGSKNSLTGDADPRWVWEQCKTNPPEATFFGFGSTQDLKGLPIIKNKYFTIGDWSDFNYALTAPSTKKCN